MRVCTDHHSSRECVVLQYNLVDDASSRFPEANSVSVGDILQELVYLTVGDVGGLKVTLGIMVGLYQVVTMHCGGYRNTGATGIHQLQQGHLGSSILHRHPVGCEIHIVGCSLIVVSGTPGEMGEQNLLSSVGGRCRFSFAFLILSGKFA